MKVVVSVSRDKTEFVKVKEMYTAGYHQCTNDTVYLGPSALELTPIGR